MLKLTDKPEPVNYLDNEEMLKAILDYKEKCRKAKEEGREKPQMSDYLGRKLSLIADGLAKRYNFSGYSFVDEMKLDAIENCILYFDSFNPNKVNPKTGKKYDNPHAYFTMVTWHAFVRRILKEKKQFVLKHRVLQNMVAADEFMELNANPNFYNNPYMDEVAEMYDESEKKKKGRGRPKKEGTTKNETKKRTQRTTADS